MPQLAAPVRARRRGSSLSLTLVALFLPGVLFACGLLLVRNHPRYSWLSSPASYPWELWLLLVGGIVGTTAGVLDWRYHRSGKTVIGRPEHNSELAALAGGGLPLFLLMAAASSIDRPRILLIPVLVVVLFTVVMICYDEFVYHRKRCGPHETLLHRFLVFGNGIAWLAWAHWCFVRGG
jgi:hypothetical protein